MGINLKNWKQLLLKFMPTSVGVYVISTSVAILFAYLFIRDLYRTIPLWLLVAPHTALVFFLLAAALVTVSLKQPTKWIAKLRLPMFAVAASILLLTWAEYLFGWTSGIDTLLFHDTVVTLGNVNPGRMGQDTLVALSLLTLSYLLVDSKIRWVNILAICLAPAAGLIGTLRLLIYLFDAINVSQMLGYHLMTLTGAIWVVALSVGVLSSTRGQYLIHSLLGDGLGSTMAGRIWPYVILIPIVGGWLGFKARITDVINPVVVVALAITSNFFGLIVLGGISARLLNKIDSTRKQVEQALYESELRFRSTFEQAAVGIAHVLPTGKFLLINQRFCDLLGYSRDELLSKTFQDITYPDDADSDVEQMHQLLRGESRTISLEKRYYRKDQSIQWVQQTSALVKRDNGTPKYFISVVEDINERKRAEEELYRLNRTLSVLSEVNQAIVRIRPIEALYNKICQIAVETGGFRMAWIGLVDPQTKQMTPVAWSGVTEDYLNKLNIAIVDEPRGQGPTASAFRTGHAVIAQDIEHDPRLAPWREDALRLGYHASGAFPLKVAGQPRGVLTLYANQPDYFDSQELILFEELAADVSFAMEFDEQEEHRIQAEMSLIQQVLTAEEMRLFLQTTLDAFPANTVVLDGSGTIITANSAWKRFGEANNSTSELHYLGTNYLRVCETANGPESAEAGPAIEGIMAVIDGRQESFYLEYPCHSPTENRWFSMRVTPFPEHTPRRVVVAHLNITERREAENALRESETRFRTLIESAPMGIAIIRGERTIYQNTHYMQLFGYDNPEELIDHPFIEQIAPQCRDELLERTHRRDRGEVVPSEYETIGLRKDGSQFPYSIWVKSMNFADGPAKVAFTWDLSERKHAEEALRESEAHFRSLLMHLPAGVVVHASDTHIVMSNQAANDLLGLTSDQLLGKTAVDSAWNFLREDGSVMPIEEYPVNQVLTTGQPLQQYVVGVQNPVFPYPHWGLVSAYPQISDSHELQEIVVTFVDITERKRAEASLRDSEALYYQVAETAQEGIWTINADGYTTFVNPMLSEILGYSAGEMIGRTAVSVLDDEAAAITVQHFANRQAGLAERYEIRFRRKDGIYRWASVSSSPMYDEKRHYSGAVALVSDITERKQAEEALRASEARFRTMIESAPFGIGISRNDLIIYGNAKYQEMFGYESAEEMIGLPLIEQIAPQCREEIADRVRRRYTSEIVPTEYETIGLRKDGSQFPFAVWVTLMELADGPASITFFLDISERKKTEHILREQHRLQIELEKEKELSELKSRFVSMASHEFRTPLAAILATTETLTIYRDKMDEAQVNTRLDKIRQQVMHMKDIMEDVLQLARIQAGRLEIHPEQDDMDGLCRDIIEEFESQPQHRGRIKYHCDRVPLITCFDNRLMRQVISNLIANALKYSPIEKIIEIDLSQESAGVTLQVRDAGIGIPPEDMKRLFEPFHRATNVGTISGTGLGLSITKQAVEMHGGVITVESREGVGTTFTVTIAATSESV